MTTFLLTTDFNTTIWQSQNATVQKTAMQFDISTTYARILVSFFVIVTIFINQQGFSMNNRFLSKTGLGFSLFLTIALLVPQPTQTYGFSAGWLTANNKVEIAVSAVLCFLFISYLRLVTKDKKEAKNIEAVWEDCIKISTVDDAAKCAWYAWDDVFVGLKEKNPYMYIAGSKMVIPEDKKYLYTFITQTNEKIDQYVREGRKAQGIMGNVHSWWREAVDGLKLLKETKEVLAALDVTVNLRP